jgi:hypothetical protein
MNQDSTFATHVAAIHGFLATRFASELYPLPQGDKCVFEAIVGVGSPARSTYDVEVERTEAATVKEGPAAIFVANRTIVTRWWLLEKKCVIWVDRVLDSVG